MSLLTDDDKALLVLEHLGPAALAGDTMSLYDCFQLALDVAEKAVLAKLGTMELPEPDITLEGYIEDRPAYSPEKCRQWGNTRYAQGAAAQISSEPVGEVSAGTFIHWRNDNIPKVGTPLYTRREAK